MGELPFKLKVLQATLLDLFLYMVIKILPLRLVIPNAQVPASFKVEVIYCAALRRLLFFFYFGDVSR